MAKNKTDNTKVKVKKKPGRKPKRKVYFGQDVQDAIIRYNESKLHSDRNKIYQEEIKFMGQEYMQHLIS